MLSKKSQESAAVSSIPEYSVAGSTNLRSRFEWRSSVPEVLGTGRTGGMTSRECSVKYIVPRTSLPPKPTPAPPLSGMRAYQQQVWAPVVNGINGKK